MPPRISLMFVLGSHAFETFYAHECVKNGEYLYCMHIINFTTFTIFAQNSTVGCMLALYSPTMHIATLIIRLSM